MKALMVTTFGIFSLLTANTLVYAANTHDPEVNARQHVQKHRIKEGMRSGELTARETRRLRKQQQGINRLEKAYKSDGHLTRAERNILHHAQDRASRQIYKQKHDGQRR